MFARFASDANDPPRRDDMRVLVGRVTSTFHDVDTLATAARGAALDPHSYDASRALARTLRESGSNGLVYLSVRDAGGRYIAAFWTDVAGIPTQERHLQYEWDGKKVTRYFDYKCDAWTSVVETPAAQHYPSGRCRLFPSSCESRPTPPPSGRREARRCRIGRARRCEFRSCRRFGRKTPTLDSPAPTRSPGKWPAWQQR
jgi:hypothetical protein